MKSRGVFKCTSSGYQATSRPPTWPWYEAIICLCYSIFKYDITGKLSWKCQLNHTCYSLRLLRPGYEATVLPASQDVLGCLSKYCHVRDSLWQWALVKALNSQVIGSILGNVVLCPAPACLLARNGSVSVELSSNWSIFVRDFLPRPFFKNSLEFVNCTIWEAYCIKSCSFSSCLANILTEFCFTFSTGTKLSLSLYSIDSMNMKLVLGIRLQPCSYSWKLVCCWNDLLFAFVAHILLLRLGLCQVYTTEVWFHFLFFPILGIVLEDLVIWEGVSLSILLGALMPAPFFILTRKYWVMSGST